MSPGFDSTRAQPNVAVRAAEKAAGKGWALTRAITLVLATGVLVAVVLATLFAGLVIAIDGKLP
jgi:hypothetical protein